MFDADTGRMASRSSGISLILVAGLLALLAVVAGQTALLAGVDRRAGGARLLEARVTLLARSGIESAHARLVRGMDAPRPATAANQGDDWTFRDGPAVPLERAHNPSYARGERYLDGGPADGRYDPADGSPDLFPAAQDLDGDGRHTGLSGRLRGTNHVWGDCFSLAIEDESAKINVNGGLLDALDRDADGTPDHRDADVRIAPGDPRDPGIGWNFQLARILDVLGSDTAVSVPGLGQAALGSRPTGGYASVEHLQGVLGIATDLSPYLTVSSWIDRSVIHPHGWNQPRSGLPAQSPIAGFGAHSDIKLGRMPLALEEGGRPPVNLNAAPRAVLQALVQDLTAYATPDPESVNWSQIDAARAATVVDRIVWRQKTDPFGSWEEFAAFCEPLADGNAVVWRPAHDLLKSNFDPNTHSAKEHPDQLRWRNIDKTDLNAWSTEGSLGPTGTFLIASYGRVLEGTGRAPAASALIETTVELFRPLRQTSQADFVAGRTPDATNESALSLADPVYRTYGASATWNSWDPGRGLAVATYPSAMTALPAGASTVDGYVALATVEMAPLEAAPGMPLRFLHHFDDAWDAEDLGDPAAAARVPGANDNLLQTDLTVPPWPAASQEPGTVYPDGAHCQFRRSVGFRCDPNFPSFEGAPAGNRAAISYWVKTPTIRQYLRLQFRCLRFVPGIGRQSLQIGEDGAVGLWGVLLENTSQDGQGDASHEQMCQVTSPRATPGMRWILVTACIDSNEPLKERQVYLILRGFPAPAPGVRAWTRYGAAIDPTTNEDLRADNARMILGMDGTEVAGNNRGNQVLDELAIHDLGDDAAIAQAAADALSLQRFQDGRYYKGDDGAFLSSVLEPAAGAPVRILRADWTAYLPREARPELGNFNFSTPRPLDPVLARARVEMELVDDATPATLTPLVRGAPLGTARGRFRYRARFVNALAEAGFDPLNTGVQETPILDDITFFWQPATGPRVVAWSMR